MLSSRNDMHKLMFVVLAGCAMEPTLGETDQAVTVGGIGATCSTSAVIGLSKQIADEVGCMSPDSLVPFVATSKVTITSNAVLPYLAKNAKTDLLAAANSGVLQVNSAFRTIAQQYLLYQWYQEGKCGITAAATVGNSNHESGRAVDLANWSSRVSAMSAHGWSHDVPGDDVHFDHLGSADIRGRDTLAFQRLWNANHPEDKIGEDGDYGPQTASRLAKSPAGGFAIGASCKTTGETDAAELVSVTGPDKVAPASQAHYSITLKNAGSRDWPATTKLVTADGMASPLHDASWTSDTVVASLDAAVKAGASATIEMDVTTPSASEDTPIQQLFTLADGTKMFGTIPVALTVTMGDPSTSGDASEGDDGGGGCSAGGGGAGWLLLVGVALFARKRTSPGLGRAGSVSDALVPVEAVAFADLAGGSGVHARPVAAWDEVTVVGDPLAAQRTASTVRSAAVGAEPAMRDVLAGITARRMRNLSAILVALVAGCGGTEDAAGPDGGDDVDAGVVVDGGSEAPIDAPSSATLPVQVLRGVDRAGAFSVAEAKTLETDHGVKWTGVYIGGACNAGSGWSKSVVQALHAATQWQFMPIWVGQQSSSICSSHTLTAAQGKADGEAAVAKMKTFGWKANLKIPVALDVEGGTYSGNPSGANAYVKAWVAAVHADGYRAYAYSSPSGVSHFHDNGTGLDGAWVASWFFNGFHDSKPADLTQIGNDYSNQNRAWQYAGDFAVSGAGHVDADTSDLPLAPNPE